MNTWEKNTMDNGVWPPLRPVTVAQKNKPSTMLSSHVQSIDLPMDCTAWRIGIRGRESEGAAARPDLKNFRANSVFRASASCSKILNDRKYFNTVENSTATLFFKASASCSKVLNNIKYIFSTVNSGYPLFFRASASCSKILNVKSIFNTVKIFNASVVSQESWMVKNIFNTVKDFRGNSVFRASASC